MAVIIACGLITLAICLALKKPTEGSGSKERESARRIAKSPDSVTKPNSPKNAVDRVSTALGKLLNGMRESDTVDIGTIATGFAESEFAGLEPAEMLAVIAEVNFSSSEGNFQGPAFLLDSAAETLRDRASEADVKWVAERICEASTDQEMAKWLKVLDLIGREGNQVAYINLLNDLPVGDPDSRMIAAAQVIGKVLGGIASEESVRSLLAAAADERTTMGIAVDSSIGYVQEQRAIKPISELIDGPGEKRQPQIAAAVGMLGYIPSEYSVMSLRNLSLDPDAEIAKLAKDSLKLLLSNNPGLESVSSP